MPSSFGDEQLIIPIRDIWFQARPTCHETSAGVKMRQQHITFFRTLFYRVKHGIFFTVWNTEPLSTLRVVGSGGISFERWNCRYTATQYYTARRPVVKTQESHSHRHSASAARRVAYCWVVAGQLQPHVIPTKPNNNHRRFQRTRRRSGPGCCCCEVTEYISCTISDCMPHGSFSPLETRFRLKPRQCTTFTGPLISLAYLWWSVPRDTCCMLNINISRRGNREWTDTKRHSKNMEGMHSLWLSHFDYQH